MDITSALLIYRLNKIKYTRKELDLCYKGLVKKYHPDRNQNFADWCHKKMLDINEAYEILMEHLETEIQSDNPINPESNPKKNPEYSQKNDSRTIDFFTKATAVYFEGIHIYYDYGLTKRTIRQEGVWRFHYRKSVRMMQKALDDLNIKNTGEASWELFLNFGNSFLMDIQSFDPDIPLSMRGSQTHIAYSDAVRNIDKALSEFFSVPPEDRESRLSPLYRASRLLILLVENYPHTEWHRLALQKLNLLDSFLDLKELLRTGKVTF